MVGSSLTGNQIVVNQLQIDGVRHVFGNPGTVEQGLISCLDKSVSINYVMGLHEGSVVAMADGYARASGGLAVMQLHSSVGLGNGMGNLYQAFRGQSPLLVLVGEAGVKYQPLEGQMAADLKAMAQTVTKDVFRVEHVDSTARIIRRAIKTALTPPKGPVLVILPADVMDQRSRALTRSTALVRGPWAARTSDVSAAARLLEMPGKTLILAGDGVEEAEAHDELAETADILNADIYAVNDSGFMLDSRNSRFKGQMGHMFGEQSQKIVRQAENILILGTYLFPEVYPSTDDVFGPENRIVHIDTNATYIGKNHAVDVGILADCGEGLRQLNEQFRQDGLRPISIEKSPDENIPPPLTADPLTHLAYHLAKEAPKGAYIFDEALTQSGVVRRYLKPERGLYAQTRGGSLGVGIPGAIGSSLSRNSWSIAFTGDGASMYTCQALWTAARLNTPCVFVICNNHKYQLLSDNLEAYWESTGVRSQDRVEPDSFNLLPGVDFSSLASSLGVESLVVDSPHAAAEAARYAFSHHRPILIDVKMQY